MDICLESTKSESPLSQTGFAQNGLAQDRLTQKGFVQKGLAQDRLTQKGFVQNCALLDLKQDKTRTK
jgi:hypothetical protein